MSTQKRRPRWRIGLVALAALMVGIPVLLRAIRPTPSIPKEKIVAVQRGDIARSVVAIGRVEPRSKVEVKSKANGIIRALLVDLGDTVEEGQILAELDKENLQARVREAQATLQAEDANLSVAKASETRARVEADNPALKFARRELERIQALSEQGVASQQDLDDAQRSYETAENRQRLLEADVTRAAALVTQAQARVAAAQAALDRAQENLRYASIRSPIAGIVLTRDTEVGDAVSSILNLGSAATLIMTLGDLSTVYVEGEVDEADVGPVKPELPVRTTVESFPEESFSGTVTRVGPMGRERNNVTTFEVRVSISNPEGRLRVNMSANAEIILEEHREVLLIPEGALRYDRDRQASVQLLDPGAAEGSRSVAVQVGISNGRLAEILSGLEEKDSVVLP
jgi:HlyD family secretion protein